jgi:large subunit ribosomal protein L30
MGANENADDYLDAAEYRGHARAGTEPEGLVSFTHANGQFYFTSYDAGGNVVLRSEGYPTKSARDNGMASVAKNRGLAERYSVEQADGGFYTVLKAGNHQEIARSAPQASEAAARALIPGASPVAARSAAQSAAKPVAKAAAPRAAANGQLRVTQLRSVHGQLANIAASVRGLGLRRRHHSVTVGDTAENRGMITTARHILKVERI